MKEDEEEYFITQRQGTIYVDSQIHGLEKNCYRHMDTRDNLKKNCDGRTDGRTHPLIEMRGRI